ncbi:MAG TPA: hypothetical protein VN645_09165 [Steroidobacteraceae bacterium]|nr:hypothetical protein [Steroidobacteraceae bacterium]
MNKWLRMTAIGTLLPALMLVSLITLAAAPAPELTGMWQGKLAVDPKTSLTIQFNFAKDAKGAYTATLNSPDNPAIKNTPASGVTWDGTNLKLQVPALQGNYAGTLKNGAVTGTWTQPGANLPLVIAPYAKPVVSKQAATQINGSWIGSISPNPAANLTITVQFKFKTDDKGNLTGTFSIPDQGLIDSEMTDVEFADGKLSARIPRANNAQFIATLANSELKGNLKISGAAAPPDGIPVSLKKGEAPVHALKLTSEQFAALSGKWEGKMEIQPPPNPQNAAPPKMTLTMVLRFNTNTSGQYVAFLDSPDQKAKDIPIDDVTLTNGELAFKVAIVRGEYKGKLAGSTLTGEWVQANGAVKAPLVLTRQP